MSDLKATENVRKNYGSMGGWLVTVSVAGLIEDGWSENEADARSLARGMAMNLEQQVRVMAEKTEAQS